MRAEHLKGWISEAQEEEAKAEKVAEGAEEAVLGSGGEEAEG